MGNYLLSIGDHVFFFIFGLLIPMLSIQQGKPSFQGEIFTTQNKIKLYYSNGLAMWFGVFLIAVIWIWNKRILSSIGFTAPVFDTWVYALTGMIISAYLIDLLIETKIPARRSKSIQQWKENTPFLPANGVEYRHFIFAAFTAAFCEEVIFRGFFINYVLAFSGGSTLGVVSAIILPAMLFGVMHIYQGHVAVIKIIIGGILFGLIYYLSQSLMINIIIHFIIDLIAGWASILLAKEVQLSEDV